MLSGLCGAAVCEIGGSTFDRGIGVKSVACALTAKNLRDRSIPVRLCSAAPCNSCLAPSSAKNGPFAVCRFSITDFCPDVVNIRGITPSRVSAGTFYGLVD